MRCKTLKENIAASAEKIYLSGLRHFICGMARGSDLYFCEAMLILRANHPSITIEAAVPYERQSAGWRDDERERYSRLLKQCDYTAYASMEYTRGCIHLRNRYMVDNSSVLLAVYDGKRGGTSYTINYAARRGLEIIEIVP